MKWLFVTNEAPWPLNHGTWLRVYHLARTLTRRSDSVSILAYQTAGDACTKYAEVGVTLLTGPAGEPIYRGWSRCWGGPYAYDKTFADHVARHAGQFDAVVLVRPRMLQYAHEASRGGRVLADLVDDPILEEQRARRRGWSPLRAARFLRFMVGEYHYERTFLPAVSISVFVSSHDADSFYRRHKTTPTAVVSNGVDAAYFARPPQYAAESDRPTVTFLGNMIHPPNEEAAMFLIRDVAPLIWRQVPETQVLIVGSNPSRRLRGQAGLRVRVTGLVQDVRPLLWGTRVCLLPMQTGTGIKNKLLESWAAGIPVVATPLACQGVPAQDGQNVLLGRSPAELAQQTVRLMKDPPMRQALADHGRRTVSEHLTWSNAADQLRKLVLSS